MPSDMRDLEDEFASLDDLGELDDLDRELGAGQPVGRRKETLRILPISIAATALLLFGGVVFYAYSQGVRSGSEGTAPLLKPDHVAKVQPDDPGGLKVPHQDKLVYNQIEEQVDDSQVERLLPPPEQPVKPPAAKPDVTKKESDIPPIPSITGPIKPKVKSKEPLLINPDAEKEEEAPLAQSELVAPAVAPTTNNVEAIAKKVEAAPAQTVVETTTAKPKVSVPTAINKSKDWRVQIGAVGSDDKARSEFQRHQKKHSDLLGKLSLEVQKVKVNGKDYFRIRIGPVQDKNAAVDLCGKLKNRGLACITVAPDK